MVFNLRLKLRRSTIRFTRYCMTSNNFDLTNLSVAELRDLSAKAGNLLQDKQESQIADAYEKIKAIASAVNMSVDEIAVWGGNQARKRKKVSVKYVNKNNPTETWTGRGQQPRWVKAELAAGKKLEDFAV